jgi:hypothetical protein
MKIIEKQFLVTATMTVVVIGLLMAAVLDHYKRPKGETGHVPLVPLYFLAGCVGGITNHYRRLQSLPLTEEQLTSITSPYSFIIQSIASPCLGGVFAVTLYLAFGSSLIKGPLFPEFTGAGEPYNSDEGLKGLFDLIPCTNKDVAMMFIWAFVAGFSERFVPNWLDKLALDANDGAHVRKPPQPTGSLPHIRETPQEAPSQGQPVHSADERTGAEDRDA